MHVALLSHEYPPYIFGGIGTFMKNLARGLSRCGVKVTVISGYPASKMYLLRHGVDEESDNGVTILRFPYPNIPPRHTMFQLANLKRLYKSIEDIDVDVIHGQGGSTFPSLLNLKNLAPLVVTFHSSPKAEKAISCYSFLRGGSFGDFWTYVIGYPAWSYTFREELCNSHLAVAVSKTVMSDLLEEMGETHREKIREIHNGIDLETLDREYANIEDDIEESDSTILFAGRMFWRKGILNLVKLAYLLQKEKSNFRIVVHGGGPLLGRMRSRIRSLGLTNIELKGFTSKAQLMRSMKRSRFVIVPSFYEACPMILLESMCLGKIPIMFNLPFALEFTECGRYGILAKDIRTLVDKLKTAYIESDLLSFSDRVKHFARRKYDIRTISLRYLDVYRSACG
jgi:glycosyltransferase involved in cell wall biosynthesis